MVASRRVFFRCFFQSQEFLSAAAERGQIEWRSCLQRWPGGKRAPLSLTRLRRQEHTHLSDGESRTRKRGAFEGDPFSLLEAKRLALRLLYFFEGKGSEEGE